MLDKKTFAIGVLSLSAVLLLVANILAPRTASATFETIQDQDYSMVTATAVGGGDAVYITNKRSGKMGVFVYSPARKVVEPIDAVPVPVAFAKAIASAKKR